MNDPSSNDAGTIQVLLERLNTQRLPRALDLKSRVDRGECLADYDLEFLQNVLTEARSAQSLIARHPEYHDLVGRLISLYGEITRQGLENEQKG